MHIVQNYVHHMICRKACSEEIFEYLSHSILDLFLVRKLASAMVGWWVGCSFQFTQCVSLRLAMLQCLNN